MMPGGRSLDHARWSAVAVAVSATLVVAAHAAEIKIVQKDRAFSVKQVTVRVGDSVTFVNADAVNHNVFSEAAGAQFDLVQPPGSTQTVKLIQPGRVEVQCAIHRAMRLEILVTP